MSAITKEQAINLKATDLAFQYSVQNRDTENMQIVLRAHGFKHSQEHAEYAIWFAEQA